MARNMLRIAGICSLVIVGLYFLFQFTPAVLKANTIWMISTQAIISILAIFYCIGFLVIGKKYKNRFLVVISYIMIILIILHLATYPFVINIMKDVGMNIVDLTASFTEIPPEQLQSAEIFPQLIEIIMPFLIYLAIIIVIYAILAILFGVALLRLKDKVEYSRITGILNIVGGATAFILIGFFVIVVAFIYEIIILFKEAKKLDKPAKIKPVKTKRK